jgi:hypothetical protein
MYIAVPIPKGTATNVAPSVTISDPVMEQKSIISSMGYQRMLKSEARSASQKVGMPSRTRKKKMSATKRMAEYPEALIKRVMTNSYQLRDFSMQVLPPLL